ncbi:MAG: NAD(P)-dependent oxidoreductase [Pseudomonadales bacterium]|nr:NAD(P)-dependent oxidoreductase [Pseudomonadales bacterium]MDP7596340.1 NAD(P)-dependent oxidoreductase [Pseudomonadales bacterium]HJN49983.1 NAD(P)-dependent oxidoreductase [Pseudomonadales bacterium]
MKPDAILLLPQNWGQRRLEQLSSLAAKEDLVTFKLVDSAQPMEAILPMCEGSEVLITMDRVETNEIAVQIPGLKLVQTFSAGTERLDKALLLNHGIKVANNGGANAVCVAEYAIWFMLTIAHKFDRQIESVRAGKWAAGISGPLAEFQTLVDKRVGIIGLGRIGSRVARRLIGWECEVVYHDIATFEPEYELRNGARRVSLDELLSTSDIVSLHVPLDSSTKGMIGAAQLSAMKSTAILINTCRGPVVVEADLVSALRAGEVFGAGMDVTEVEPIDPDSPLISLPNVAITPHLGARSLDSERNADLNVLQNAERVARGEEPLWVVDPT